MGKATFSFVTSVRPIGTRLPPKFHIFGFENFVEAFQV
jgi:hypothetical protein